MDDVIGRPAVGGRSKPRIRELAASDIPEAVNLILRVFDSPHPKEFWLNVFARLSRRTPPDGFPKYGYVLENNGKLVGLILYIYSIIWENGSASIRCNGSTVCTDPEFRFYAPLLYSRAHVDKSVTVLNITAAKHTYRMIEALGFTRYIDRVFLTIPVLSSAPGGGARVVDATTEPGAPFDPHERDLLLDHAEWGCISLWCVTRERAFPFVFRQRMLKNVAPCAQLIYCADIDSFRRFARPLGLYLAKRLIPLVLVNADEPLEGIVGWRQPEISPKYFRGPKQPRVGDLAYTETAMFGI